MVHPDAESTNKRQKLFTKAVCEGDLNTMMSYYVDDSLEYSDYGKFCHIWVCITPPFFPGTASDTSLQWFLSERPT